MINPFIYLIIFIKASLFSSGGLANLPSLHQDLIENGWAKEADFAQSVAIGQISPGPNGLWVIALGYFTYGYLGALLALVGICIPPLLVLPLAAMYNRVEERRWVQGLMRGIQLAVVGLLLTVAWSLVGGPQVEWQNVVIGLAAFGLGLSRKVSVIGILALAAVTGYLLYGL